MTKVLDGKALAQEIRSEVADGVQQLLAAGGRPPGLAAVLVGENPASQVYVRTKARASEKAGLVSRTVTPPATIAEEELLDIIDQLNDDDEIDGILVQLPLPDSLDESRILARVSPPKTSTASTRSASATCGSMSPVLCRPHRAASWRCCCGAG